MPMGKAATRVYSDLVQSVDDPTSDLATYVGALGDELLQDIEDLVRDGDNGETGWSPILDLNRIPDEGLDYIAQYIGVRFPFALTAAQKKQRIATTDGWNRGSIAAFAAAPLPYLTGTKTVIIRERDPAACAAQPAYGITVITYTSETPDSAKVLAALLEQKPAGLVLAYNVLTGEDYQSLLTNHPLYSNVFADFATYQGVATATPGT